MATQYATQTDLALYGLSAAALAPISPTAQDAALLAASQIADGYLGFRFKVPLTQVGADIKANVCAVAAWIAMRPRGFKPGTRDADSLHEGYKDAIKWFESIQAGKTTPMGVIDADTGEEPGSSDTGQGAPFVVSPNSVDTSQISDRESQFFGRDKPASLGVVGPPRLRGWNG